jgi:hypothetical protein
MTARKGDCVAMKSTPPCKPISGKPCRIHLCEDPRPISHGVAKEDHMRDEGFTASTKRDLRLLCIIKSSVATYDR